MTSHPHHRGYHTVTHTTTITDACPTPTQIAAQTSSSSGWNTVSEVVNVWNLGEMAVAVMLLRFFYSQAPGLPSEQRIAEFEGIIRWWDRWMTTGLSETEKQYINQQSPGLLPGMQRVLNRHKEELQQLKSDYNAAGVIACYYYGSTIAGQFRNAKKSFRRMDKAFKSSSEQYRMPDNSAFAQGPIPLPPAFADMAQMQPGTSVSVEILKRIYNTVMDRVTPVLNHPRWGGFLQLARQAMAQPFGI